MQTKIDSSIWDDIGPFDADTKIAVLWLLTSRAVNSLGYVEVVPRIFVFETGAPISSIEGACKGLPRGFIRTEKGVFLRNFIRRQFGSGPALERSHMCKTLVKHLLQMPADVISLVLAEYPELAKHHQRSLQPPAKVEGEGEGEGEGIGSAEGKGAPLSLADAHAHAKRYCASSPTGLTYNADQVELWFADRKRKSWEATSGQLINTPAIAKGDLEFWLRKAKTGSAPGGNHLPSRPGMAEKKEVPAAAQSHPLMVPPDFDWEAAVAEMAPAMGWSAADVAAIKRLNWRDLAVEHRQAIIDHHAQKQGGAKSK